MSIIKSIKGFFGQTIHYKDGVRIGETWDGLIPGTKKHYDEHGGHAGYSSKGFIADEVHYNRDGEYIGSSYDGGYVIDHYGVDGSRSVSIDGILGTNTYIPDNQDTLLFSDSDSDSSSFDDFIDSDW